MPVFDAADGVFDSTVNRSWGCFCAEPATFDFWLAGVVLVVLSIGAGVAGMCDPYVPGSDIDVVIAFEINLPSALGLIPLAYGALGSVVFRALLQTVDGDNGSWCYEVVFWVFADSVDPVLLPPSFVASGDNVVLLGDLADLPDFEFVDIFDGFSDLSESIMIEASAHRDLFPIFGGFGGAFAA